MVSPTPPEAGLATPGLNGKARHVFPGPTSCSKPCSSRDAEHEALLQLTQALFCSIDLSGIVRSVSRSWCEKMGTTQESAVGEHFLHFVHEEDAEFCQEEFQRLLTGNPPRDCAVRLNTTDGAVRWLNLKPSVSQDAGVIYILATDITVERCADRRLPDSNLILDHVRQGVLVIDAGQPGSPIVYTNFGFERLTGYLSNEARGRSLHFLTGARTDPTALQNFEDALSRGETVNREILHYRKDGSEFWDQLVLSPVIDSQGEVSHFIAVLEDISDRKRTNEALRDNNRSLNAALDDLKKTKDVVIQRERLHALGQMASGIAHDFNNLLAPILGFSELLINMPEYLRDEERARGYLEKVRNSAQEGAAVVGRMREFYRKQDEDEDFAPLNLAEIAREAISLTAHHWHNQAEARGLHIEMEDRTSEVPAVRGCETDLRQLVINLILNSVDAMPSNGTISVSCQENGSWVTLEVADTGSGMDQETRRQCLEPFFTTKGKAGTGLGLSIVFGVVQRHKGRIEVDSAPGEGTRFTINLPVCRQDPHASKETLDQIDSQALNILLIDDEDLLLEAISEQLMNLGHRVSCHLDPSQALACVYKENFDLVITDRAMPGMTGDSVAKSIKEYRPDLPVIMLTGFGDIMLQTGEQPENIDLVLSKPVSIGTIRETLSRFNPIAAES